MTRLPGHVTREGQHWYAELHRAQLAVDEAANRRDDLARQALAHGLGVRGVARALGIDKGTASRRYSSNAGAKTGATEPVEVAS